MTSTRFYSPKISERIQGEKLPTLLTVMHNHLFFQIALLSETLRLDSVMPVFKNSS